MSEGGLITKKRVGVLAVCVLALILITADVLLLLPRNSTQLRLQNNTYHLQIARTEAAKERGLGDRNTLPSNEGMVFVYAQPQNLCFWMKDMHFPLDMIWLSSDKKVVNIVHNLPPSSYPQTYCADAQYVIELNAGQADINQVTIGQKFSF